MPLSISKLAAIAGEGGLLTAAAATAAVAAAEDDEEERRGRVWWWSAWCWCWRMCSTDAGCPSTTSTSTMSTMSTSATLANPAAGGAIAGTPVAAAAGAAVAVAETVAGAVSGLVQSAIGEEQKRNTSLVTKNIDRQMKRNHKKKINKNKAQTTRKSWKKNSWCLRCHRQKYCIYSLLLPLPLLLPALSFRYVEREREKLAQARIYTRDLCAGSSTHSTHTSRARGDTKSPGNNSWKISRSLLSRFASLSTPLSFEQSLGNVCGAPFRSATLLPCSALVYSSLFASCSRGFNVSSWRLRRPSPSALAHSLRLTSPLRAPSHSLARSLVSSFFGVCLAVQFLFLFFPLLTAAPAPAHPPAFMLYMPFGSLPLAAQFLFLCCYFNTHVYNKKKYESWDEASQAALSAAAAQWACLNRKVCN